MPTHVFSAQLQLKDAVLESFSATVKVDAPRVTNFSRRLIDDCMPIPMYGGSGRELFLLGMPFRETMRLEKGVRDSYDGYCWGLTDENGYLYVDYKYEEITLTVTGSNIRRLKVIGDRRAEQWATEAYRDGDPNDKIYSDDVEWAIQWDEPASTHSVTLTRWNRPGYNACITKVMPFGDTVTFRGPTTLRHFDTLTEITPRPGEYYYGVTPNRGRLEIFAHGEIRDYIEDGIISDELMGLKIFRDEDVIATHVVSDSNYDMRTKMLTLDLTDALADWGKLKYPGRGLTEETDAFSLLAEVMGGLGYTTEDVERMCKKEIVVGTEDEEMMIAEYLKSIFIPYPYLEADTYRATIEKFCVLAQICCYSDPYGFPVFASGRPRLTKAEWDKMTELTPRGMKSPFRRTIIKKNRVKRVEVEVQDINIVFGEITDNANLLIYEKKDENPGDGYELVALDNEINPVKEYNLQIEDYTHQENPAKRLRGKARLYTDRLFFKNSISNYYKDNVVYVNSETFEVENFSNENANSTKIFQNVSVADKYIDFDFLIDLIYKNTEISLKQRRYVLNATLLFKGRYLKISKKTVVFS